MYIKYFLIFFITLTLSAFAQENSTNQSNKGRVTGIGGIFFKVENPDSIKQWYYKNLGLAPNDYGSMFEFRESDSKEVAYLQWSPFNKATKYFEPSGKDFMINYRVVNIENLVDQLKANGVTILDTIETYEYGKFVHILDPDSNKIELWEPNDSPFQKLYEGKTTK
ncbi:MAG: VOC family protein [Melioribacteraceae bacterium]|nr:VOC family protein [Melioribacteraceae bacterium]